MKIGNRRLSLFEVGALLFAAAVPWGIYFYIFRTAEKIGPTEEI